MAIYDDNEAYCRRCGEYHSVRPNSSEDVDELVAQCEAGNW